MILMEWIDNYVKAGQTNTPREQLLHLANSDNYRIRLRVAENPKTPAEVLEKLAADEHPEVRLAVATNTSAPVDITFRLAFDQDPTVRFGLAEDTRSPLGVLKLLANDDNAYVAARARKTIEAVSRMQALPAMHSPFTWDGVNSHAIQAG